MAPTGDVEVVDDNDDNIWVYFSNNTNDSKPPSGTPSLPKSILAPPGSPSTVSPRVAEKSGGGTVGTFWKDIMDDIVSSIEPKPATSPDAFERRKADEKKKKDEEEVKTPPAGPSIKYYDTNKVIFNDSPAGSDTDINEFEDLVLQEIGGRELLIVERHDMVDGINQTYQPIKNLSKYALEYSSTNIDPYPNSVVDFFEGVIFEINDHIPTQEELEAIGETALVRFDETLNSIIINVKDLLNNQFVEVEFVSFDEVVSDTIEV